MGFEIYLEVKDTGNETFKEYREGNAEQEVLNTSD